VWIWSVDFDITFNISRFGILYACLQLNYQLFSLTLSLLPNSYSAVCIELKARFVGEKCTWKHVLERTFPPLAKNGIEYREMYFLPGAYFPLTA
jgi:hypothetical protein